ncbi:GAF domain-containing protein [Scytonema sp. UIC 10036]|uniref:GAF domain-containing sensor histidine kinase n=1 Tax=Scytonema sp. UIC 10036 TaxID=2304196 RepID=UPI0012DA25D7|nr:GAF domain-containing sensor histidine kinase [Scytonema sp. UIC 10036]MUG94164.1 GAF domain-containing protein [Scytonema sp. UIC 10036]
MSSSSDLSFSRTIRNSTFVRFRELLLQMAQSVEKPSLVLTESVLVMVNIPLEWQAQRFTVLVSQQFSALFIGTYLQDKGDTGNKGDMAITSLSASQSLSFTTSSLSCPNDFLLDFYLTFDLEEIVSFISNLRGLFDRNSQTYQNLEDYCQIPVTNDARLQSKFTLLLLKDLLSEPNQSQTELPVNFPYVSVCQPVEKALQKQIAQEKLLNQVTTQIRKSLDLPVIMSTAVAQVREFLELDRLVIYKFEHSIAKSQESTISNEQYSPSLSLPNYTPFSTPHSLQQDLQDKAGCIVYEIRAHDAISSVLHYTENNCFTQTNQCWEKYKQGYTLSVDDVETTYALEECLLNFLRNTKVRAKLAAPIIFEDKLWGLLIAHQCDRPRSWTESEKILLTSVAEQLAIAIHQSELMRSLTKEKQNLEERVIERTVALHDALVAAEAASRLRSEFLATISHELLTPLTYVIGMSSTLLRWSFGELTKRQRDYLQTIHDSGEHLLEMINDILELSQIEAGKAVLNITSFSLSDAAESTVNGLKEKATLKRVNLKLDLQINAECDRFTADARRIQQILWNLLTNAVKFTPEGGNVTLRLWVEDENAVFQVEDTGIGIPEDQLSLLFEKFHQLDTPYRRRYGGTGLGLALTKQLVELHRGRIEVESTVGVGSIFTVWIPPVASS